MILTPTIPSYAAGELTDAGVAFPSLMSNSPWGLTPVISEQMEQGSNNGDMYIPAVSESGTTLCRTPLINSIRQGLSNTSLI